MSEKAVVFDKAAWHLDSVRAHGLADHQAYVHGGLFFGWAVDRGLTQRWLEERTPEHFARYRAGELTGPALLEAWDGAILDDMFTDEGLAFVVEYFDLRTGEYLGDYLRTLAQGLPSEFHVADTRENAQRLARVLDERHAAWRQEWDAAQGRPDLRIGLEQVDAEPLPDVLTLPVLAVTSGIPLPHGPLGVRAGRPDSRRAVERALAGGRRLLLLPARRKVVDPGPDDLLTFGVVAEIKTARAAEDRPDARDVTLQCVARAEVQGWPEAGVAEVRVLRDPDPDGPDELQRLEEVRLMVADVVKRRAERGDPPGMLALATAVHGAALLDVVARELQLSRQERLTVLEAPDLATRIEVVRSALEREA